MTSLLTIRPAPADCASYLVDVVPYAYDEAGRVQFKGMPGIRWVADRSAPNGRGFYRGPAEAVRIVCGVLESAGVSKARWEAATRPTEPRSKHVDWDLEQCGPEAGPALRDYQLQGSSWCAYMMRYEGAALLADDMGIGKTAQAIGALDAIGLGEARTVIVCPAVVKSSWKRQLSQWGRPGGVRSNYILASYEGFQKLAKRGEIPEGVGALVIDEIHYCSNPKAARTKAIVDWCAARPNVRRLGLSGTPMTTRPRDLWQPLDILWPGRFGSAWDFQRRYCDGKFEEVKRADGGAVLKPNGEPLTAWVSDGCSRAGELHTRLGAVMLRRTKADVALELPPKVRQVHEVELPARALRDLQRASAAIDWAGGAGPGGVRGSIGSLLSNVEQYKIAAACDLARDVTASGGRPLILTTRKASAEAIGAELRAPVVHGDTDPLQREATLAAAECGVATIYSVTTGITLTNYDTVIFTGLDWVPANLRQAEDRIHRIGQRASCTIYYLIGKGTLDEVVRERVIERLDTIASVVGGTDEAGMSADLGGGTEDELIAALVAAVRKAS